MIEFCPVVIIGAGPYGLSVAAHLRMRGVEFQIFGTPMYSWRAQMPIGMFLKSHGFASNLYNSRRCYTLKRYCAENAIEYSDYGLPISIETFTAYGLSFQRRSVPNVEEREVVSVEQTTEGFLLHLDKGDRVWARRVIVAVGASTFQYIPENLSHLNTEFVSHSSRHSDLSHFKGRDVSVLGAGASALDLVALLHAAGARVRLIARRSSLSWNTPYEHTRPAWRRWYPLCGLGGGDWRKRFYEHGPMLFRHLPSKSRQRILSTVLGPAGGWPVRECVERLPVLLGHELRRAEPLKGGLKLHLAAADGGEREVHTEHLIAATGYRVDLHRLTLLSEALRSRIRSEASSPVLSANFESSVSSLYFIGLASANTFGPVMRFTLGARYTAWRLARNLGKALANTTASDVDDELAGITAAE